MARNYRTGFTLVELLVVIAIITILTGIILPVFARVRTTSWQTSCQERLRQISIATLLYQGDFEGFLPTPVQGVNEGVVQPKALLWSGQIEPYMPDRSSLFCPLKMGPAVSQAVEGGRNIGFSGTTFARLDRRQLSIGMNALVAASFGWKCRSEVDEIASSSGCTVLYNESQIGDPTHMVLYGDSVPVSPTSAGGGYWLNPLVGLNTPFGAATRHLNDHMNLGTADGRSLSISARKAIPGFQDQPIAAAQCINFGASQLVWDLSATNPIDAPLCQDRMVWN